ncbi:MAG: hypothetical protein K2W85_11965, partial [Phycisphaerales bacterium]|nr:hypothetical protein [Phycisphaerales bacterium]
GAAPFPFLAIKRAEIGGCLPRSATRRRSDSRARNVSKSPNTCLVEKIYQQIFYKRLWTLFDLGEMNLRGCEKSAAMRYLDADETISNESIGSRRGGSCTGVSGVPGLEGVKHDLRV